VQPDLFSYIPPVILGDRDGESFSRERDGARLNKQAQDVFNFMSLGRWSTLREISKATGHPEASVSARLRDLRKPKFGGFTVERRALSKGLWQYRMGKGG
jgi:hypothetical protein